MKNLILILFLIPALCFGQQILTQINGWNAYVHLPSTYNNNTDRYPTIIFFPGTGEVGTVASKVIANGPGAYIAQGWNGNVTVDGNTIEFIVISLQPPAAYPNEIAINQRLQTIKTSYRVDTSRLYLTGLSHGGWCATTYVTGGYESQITAVVEVQGVRPDDNSPYPNLFDNFALAGGKLLGFEQKFDGRDVQTRVNRMNTTKPNSAIYVQTNFGGGGHCCWNEFYGGNGKQPGNFMLDGLSQNIYQWMARQSKGLAPGECPAGWSWMPQINIGGGIIINGKCQPDSIVASLWQEYFFHLRKQDTVATVYSADYRILEYGLYDFYGWHKETVYQEKIGSVWSNISKCLWYWNNKSVTCYGGWEQKVQVPCCQHFHKTKPL